MAGACRERLVTILSRLHSHDLTYSEHDVTVFAVRPFPCIFSLKPVVTLAACQACLAEQKLQTTEIKPCVGNSAALTACDRNRGEYKEMAKRCGPGGKVVNIDSSPEVDAKLTKLLKGG